MRSLRSVWFWNEFSCSCKYRCRAREAKMSTNCLTGFYSAFTCPSVYILWLLSANMVLSVVLSPWFVVLPYLKLKFWWTVNARIFCYASMQTTNQIVQKLCGFFSGYLFQILLLLICWELNDKESSWGRCSSTLMDFIQQYSQCLSSRRILVLRRCSIPVQIWSAFFNAISYLFSQCSFGLCQQASVSTTGAGFLSDETKHD